MKLNNISTRTYIINPVGNACNLYCEYCFAGQKQNNKESYIKKSDLEQLFYNLIKYHLLLTEKESPTKHIINISWHGGEPLIKPAGFYKKAFEVQNKFHIKSPDISFQNKIQTNGYNLSEEHIDIFKKNNVKVSVSFDGSPEIHDHYRKAKNNKPTSKIILNNINKLIKNKIFAGCLVVISDYSSVKPEQIFDFMNENKLNFKFKQAFSLKDQKPLVSVSNFSEFALRLFDLWANCTNRQITIRPLSDFILALKGINTGFCMFAPELCGKFQAINPDGGIYYCDTYGEKDDFYLGNIEKPDLAIIKYNNLSKAITKNREQCNKCSWLKYCGQGCPRYYSTENKTDVFCSAYKTIFSALKTFI